eukprot:CAMPEP_0116575648 /NCGR_PEP_ID=MMETSP0397-20121206/20074_1 /TAXON_ID=216820 /ORGANISM="Cyclophora tenuis, Strain ECT3854" /LENGTH=253 /DNA_ID=CAMNT_0004104563 /DNA_START=245 /DNA_END=1006 /DNA_ORIENTATION=+
MDPIVLRTKGSEDTTGTTGSLKNLTTSEQVQALVRQVDNVIDVMTIENWRARNKSMSDVLSDSRRSGDSNNSSSSNLRELSRKSSSFKTKKSKDSLKSASSSSLSKQAKKQLMEDTEDFHGSSGKTVVSMTTATTTASSVSSAALSPDSSSSSSHYKKRRSHQHRPPSSISARMKMKTASTLMPTASRASLQRRHLMYSQTKRNVHGEHEEPPIMPSRPSMMVRSSRPSLHRSSPGLHTYPSSSGGVNATWNI